MRTILRAHALVGSSPNVYAQFRICSFHHVVVQDVFECTVITAMLCTGTARRGGRVLRPATGGGVQSSSSRHGLGGHMVRLVRLPLHTLDASGSTALRQPIGTPASLASCIRFCAVCAGSLFVAPPLPIGFHGRRHFAIPLQHRVTIWDWCCFRSTHEVCLGRCLDLRQRRTELWRHTGPRPRICSATTERTVPSSAAVTRIAIRTLMI